MTEVRTCGWLVCAVCSSETNTLSFGDAWKEKLVATSLLGPGQGWTFLCKSQKWMPTAHFPLREAFHYISDREICVESRIYMSQSCSEGIVHVHCLKARRKAIYLSWDKAWLSWSFLVEIDSTVRDRGSS